MSCVECIFYLFCFLVVLDFFGGRQFRGDETTSATSERDREEIERERKEIERVRKQPEREPGASWEDVKDLLLLLSGWSLIKHIRKRRRARVLLKEQLEKIKREKASGLCCPKCSNKYGWDGVHCTLCGPESPEAME
jgi:hypothetical protein